MKCIINEIKFVSTLALSCSLDDEYKILQYVEGIARSRHSHIVSRSGAHRATFFQDGKYFCRPGRLSGTEKLENVSSLSSGITPSVVDHPISRSSRTRGAHEFRPTTFSTLLHGTLVSINDAIWDLF